MVLVSLWVFSLKRSTAGAFALPFRGIEPKKYSRRKCVVLELVPLSGGEHFKPRPQNRILVPLRGSFHGRYMLQVADCRLKQLVYLSQSRINPSIEANRKQPKLI